MTQRQSEQTPNPGRHGERPRPDGSDTADFGFEDVPASDKAAHVRAVFERVADRYDLMNDLMSGGIHRIWKAILLDRLNPRPSETLLDVAGGTGDLAEGYLRRGGRTAIVCDINAAMMTAGRRRAATTARRPDDLRWVCGNAEHVPLPTCSVHAYTIAFGIRNVTDRPAALAEAYRVLKPGGRFLCLEFSLPTLPLLDAAYEAYSFRVIPLLGEVIAKDRDSYQYLVESIRRFPAPSQFAGLVEDAGLARVKVQALSGGIATLTTGWRL
ncbi:MAG: class I SAM-dependent methyltransferase [Pseudomonadota bacterium]